MSPLVVKKPLLAIGAFAFVALIFSFPIVSADDPAISPSSSAPDALSTAPTHAPNSIKPREAFTVPVPVPTRCLKYINIDITNRHAVDEENSHAPVPCPRADNFCFRVLTQNKMTKVLQASAGCMSKHEHNTTTFYDNLSHRELENGLGCINFDANYIYKKIPKKMSEHAGILDEVKQLCVNTDTDIEAQKLRVLPDTHKCFLYQGVDYDPLSDGESQSTTQCFTTIRDIYERGDVVDAMCYRGTRIIDGKIKLYGGCVDEKVTCDGLAGNSSAELFFEDQPKPSSLLPSTISCCQGALCNKEIEPLNISCSTYTDVNMFNMTAIDEANGAGGLQSLKACPGGKFCYQHTEWKDDILYATAGCETDAAKYPTVQADEKGCYSRQKRREAAAETMGFDKENTETICTGISTSNVFIIPDRKLPTCYSYNINFVNGTVASVPKDVQCYTSYGEKERKVDETKHYCYYTSAVDDDSNSVFYTGGCVDKPQRCAAGGDDGINMTAIEKGRIDWFLEMLKFKQEGPSTRAPDVVYCCETTLGGVPCNHKLAPLRPYTKGSPQSTISLALLSVITAFAIFA